MKAGPVPHGLIFDMDGLLLDTERLALAAFEAAIVAHGFAFDREAYLACVGTRDEQTRAILTAHYGAEFPYEAVAARWSETYHAEVLNRPVAHRPGALAILELVERLELPVALATSTRQATAQRKLELAGLARFFHAVVGGDQVGAGKPDPEPYLQAAARLGLEPGVCWAFEDSNIGARSASSAGLWVVQVPDLLNPQPGLANVVVPSLVEAAGLLRAALAA